MENPLENKIDKSEIIFDGDDVILKSEGIHTSIAEKFKGVPEDVMSYMKDLSIKASSEFAKAQGLDRELQKLKSKPEAEALLVNKTAEENSEEFGIVNFKSDFVSNKKEVSFVMAKYFVSKYHIKTIGQKIRDIYIYENGVYVLGQNIITSEIQLILEKNADSKCKNHILEMIKDLTLTNREDFKVDKNLINLNNGILNIETEELIPHSPEYLFFTKIPINYNKDAQCPIIQRFLNEILPEEHVKIVFEWFGYCLYRSYFIKKAIIFVGERDTGKSTLIKLFVRLIGVENTSVVSLQKISSDKFASSNLYNKHINVYDDLEAKDVNDNGMFKIATGDGIITGEKKFNEQFQFQNYAKLTFACNKIPEVKDINDPAYFSRWIIIPFTARIEKVDKSLSDKINTPEELSGLLNMAILGLSEILAKQDFSYNKTPDEIKIEMLLSGSTIANFAYECLEEDIGSWVSKDDMYEEYSKYAQSNNLPVFDKTMLGRKLPDHSGYIIHGTKLIGKKQVQGWKNVKIKGKKETSDQEGYEGDLSMFNTNN